MNKKTIMLASAGVAVVALLGIIVAVIGTKNDFSRLEVKIKAVQADNKNILDNTRKAIRDAAAVSEQEVEALENIITGYAEARGSNPKGGGDGISIGMVTEAVPSITSVETLKRLQNIVVAGRKDWQGAQTNLLEIQRQANEMLEVEPSGFILRSLGKKPVEVQIVTSTETNKNFETGTDDSQWIESKKNKNAESE